MDSDEEKPSFRPSYGVLEQASCRQILLSEAFCRHFKGYKNIFCKHWYSNTSPRAVIFICHGIGDHCLWYEGLAEALVQIGFYVFTHDHGQGRSEGAHNHVDSFDEYTSVIFQHCTEVKEKYPALPFFMLGNSVGGTIALLAAIQKPCLVQGLIICAPVLMPADGPPSFTREVVTRLFLGTFFPHLKLFDIEPWRITRDCNMKMFLRDTIHFKHAFKNISAQLFHKPDLHYSSQIRKYAEDSMIHHYVKAKWCVAWMNAVMRLEDRMKSIGCPLFILHGDADPISDVKSSHVIYDEVQSLDKEIKIYPGFYHFLLLEQEENREQVFDDIIDWLKRRIQNNSDI
ncbi:monoglyceride lipase-like isoform X2 [Ostrea edulis]|uniref:monoglyceride lipase-like isoform X2 n=1 Tax=Ostrea edulis TaxID=37623 RepID=UPI002094C07F|nr:monoglyceride lipase-like isoform X2 [Ostrea edulis]